MRFIRLPGGMYGFIIKRLLLLIPIMLVVSIAIFMLLPLTGDPARAIAGPDASAEMIENARVAYGLDKPLYIQYLRWLTGYPEPDPSEGANKELIPKGVLRGDLGRSWSQGAPVLALMLERLPRTLELMFAAFIVSLVMGLLLGAISALRRKTWVDYMGMGVALFGVSIPNFWQGLMAILIFSILLGWLPAGGYGGITYLILPALVLGTAMAGSLARMTRSSMLDVLRQDYIRTARAKGLREKTVIYTHALKNAFIPVSTMLFLRLPYLFGGTVIIERVFAWPGMGSLLVEGMLGPTKDWLLIQGGVLMFIVLAVIANLFCDLTYAYLNPRIRYGEGG